MIQVTSLELSKELWEKGLKIETEKWWAHRYDKDKMELISRKETPDIIKCLTDYGYSAPSADELFAVMPDRLRIMKDGRDYIVNLPGCPESINMNFSEALSKMCLYLFEQGYVLKNGKLIKE